MAQSVTGLGSRAGVQEKATKRLLGTVVEQGRVLRDFYIFSRDPKLEMMGWWGLQSCVRLVKWASRDPERDQQFAHLSRNPRSPTSEPVRRRLCSKLWGGWCTGVIVEGTVPGSRAVNRFRAPWKESSILHRTDILKAPLLLRQKINTPQEITFGTNTWPALHSPKLARTSEAYKSGGAPATNAGPRLSGYAVRPPLN